MKGSLQLQYNPIDQERMFQIIKFNKKYQYDNNWFISRVIDPTRTSWIKVVGMLPTLPTHQELSQAGSLKQTNLV